MEKEEVMTIRRRFEEVRDDIDRRGTPGRYDEVVEERRGDPWNIARGWVRMVGAWIMVVLAVVETLLIFRLGFQLASANPNNGFVDFIYDVTGGLVDPFEGIARNRSVGDGGVFEPATPSLTMTYEPEDLAETVGDKLGFLSRRVAGDLKRFKEFIELRGQETGAWRGTIGRAL
jgi:hypothetical protein